MNQRLVYNNVVEQHEDISHELVEEPSAEETVIFTELSEDDYNAMEDEFNNNYELYKMNLEREIIASTYNKFEHS